MSDYLFSVIVPVYNTAAYLSHCIDSILAQSYLDFELILVDDGSTDGSEALCDAYANRDARICVLHQENGGHTVARNNGLRMAQGAYVLFADSDDWIDGDLLEQCCIAAAERPDVILFGQRVVWDTDSRDRPQPYPAGIYSRQQLEEQMLPELLRSGRFSLSERVVRRELYLKHQLEIDRRLLLGEDLACCVCVMAEANSAYVLPGCYYNYYQRADSTAHNQDNYTFENWVLLRQYLVQRVAQLLPCFEQQLGVCSIRFLQRAVLGTFWRAGLSPRVAHGLRKCLAEHDLAKDVANASAVGGRRIYRFKCFCLRHRLVYTLFVGEWAVRLLRRSRRKKHESRHH